jgi:hypothetical protein
MDAMDHAGDIDKFPDGWIDPLELYGDNRKALKAYGCNMDNERISLGELLEKYGANWIWDNRHRLAKLAMCLRDYPRK